MHGTTDQPRGGVIVADVRGRVLIETDEVERRGDDFHLVVSEPWCIGSLGLDIRRVVAALKDRREIHSAEFAQRLAGRGDVLLFFGNRNDRGDILRQSDRNTCARCSDCLCSQPMPIDCVVPRLIEDPSRHHFAGGEDLVADGVCLVEETGKFIDGEYAAHAVAEPFGDNRGVVREIMGALDRLPTAIVVLAPLRQVPMKERHPGLDTGTEQLHR